MGDLQAGLIVQSQLSERLPVFSHHAGRVAAELLGKRCECPVPVAQPIDGAPGAGLDGLDEVRLPTFDTQKLCVRLRSVEAVLGGGCDAGDELTLSPVERAGSEHDLVEQAYEGLPDSRMRHQQTPHRRYETEVVRAAAGALSSDLVFGGGKYVPPSKAYSLRLSFRKSRVSRSDLIKAVEEILAELRDR